MYAIVWSETRRVGVAQDCTTWQGSASSMFVADAMEAGFLPALDEDQADMFTPSELHLYQQAQDRYEPWISHLIW